MTSFGAILRTSAVLLVGTVLSKGAVFVSILLMARRLGAEDFGKFSFLFAYVAFFALLADAGIESVAIREASRERGDPGVSLGDAILLRAILIAVAVPLALFFHPAIRGHGGSTGLLLIACGSLLVSNRAPSLRSLFTVPYRIALRLEVPALLGALSEVLLLVLLFATLDRGGLTAAVSAQVLAPLPFAFLLVVLSARMTRPIFRPDWRRLVALLRTTLPLLSALVLNVVLTRVDLLLLERLRGPAEVGLYAAPVRLAEVPTLLPVLLLTSIYPVFVANHPLYPMRTEALFRGCLRILVGLVVPVILLQATLAKTLVTGLFGAEYGAGAAVLPVLAVCEFFVFVDIILSSRLLAAHLERRILVVVLAALVTNVAANLILIPAHGAVGAGYATLLAYLTRFGMTFVFRDTRLAARQALAAVLPSAAAGTATGLALFWFISTGRSPSHALLPGIALYFILLVLFRGASMSDWRAIKESRSTVSPS